MNPPLLVTPFSLLLLGRGSYRRCRRCLRGGLHFHRMEGMQSPESAPGLEPTAAIPEGFQPPFHSDPEDDAELDLRWRFHLLGPTEDPEVRAEKKSILSQVERAALRSGKLPPAYIPRLMDEVDRGEL